MELNLSNFLNPTGTTLLILLILAQVRIYLEIIGFDFNKLPITSSLNKESMKKFHKSGLYFSIGFLVFFAPGALLGS